MKKSLGSLLIWLVLATLLQAGQLASYKLTAKKTHLYQKEGVEISLVAKQLDHTDNMFFLLHPKKSDAYEIVLLHKTIDDKKYHDTTTTFTYLLFPLHSGEIEVDFDFIVQTASDRAVAHSFVDDHDDSIAIQMTNTPMPVKPLKLTVEPIDEDVVLVGDFTLSEKIDRTSMNQYESINLIYTLQGKGYDEKQLKLLEELQGVTIFSDTNTLLNKATPMGYDIQREYIYALSAKESFTIPAISLKAFSPTTKQYYTLTTPSHAIKVEHIDTAKLLDEEESPLSKHLIDFAKFKEYGIYLLLFLMGYITAKIQKPQIKRKEKSAQYLAIQAADTPKKLLMTLINQHLESRFDDAMQLLEEMVYNETPHNFQKIKKSILKKV